MFNMREKDILERLLSELTDERTRRSLGIDDRDEDIRRAALIAALGSCGSRSSLGLGLDDLTRSDDIRRLYRYFQL